MTNSDVVFSPKIVRLLCIILCAIVMLSLLSIGISVVADKSISTLNQTESIVNQCIAKNGSLYDFEYNKDVRLQVCSIDSSLFGIRETSKKNVAYRLVHASDVTKIIFEWLAGVGLGIK